MTGPYTPKKINTGIINPVILDLVTALYDEGYDGVATLCNTYPSGVAHELAGCFSIQLTGFCKESLYLVIAAGELNEIKKNGSPFEVPNYQNPDYRVQCTLSIHDPTFEYRAGETVVPRGRGFSLDEGYYGPGIHFFIDIYDALTFT